MKIRIPSPFLLMVTIALLIGVPAAIDVQCPICNGTGILTAPPDLKIEKFEYELIEYTDNDLGCAGIWYTYTYKVHILVNNKQTKTSHGNLMVVFYPPGTGEIEDAEDKVYPTFAVPIYVTIPAETAEDIERTLVYEGYAGTMPSGLYAEPHVLTTEIGEGIVCPECNGTGKVNFIERNKAILQ